ncbi:MAG: DMT family transporter [Gammaproteobacteria bacterium]|nr:DMT family transporter [Gammaproteobacteria bacterium]NVK89141.1 DMT family transporter [Gammaproteobacteria bacterium]
MNIVSILAAVAAIVLMASVPTLIKTNSANEIEIAAARLLIASLGLTVYLSVRRYSWRELLPHIKPLAILGAVFALHWYLYFKSIKLATASIAAIAVSTYGIHVTLLSAVFLKQSITRFDALVTLIGFIGIYFVVPDLDWQSDYFIGAIIGVLSGFLYAVLPILHQRFSQIDTLVRAWGQFTFAFIAFLPFVFFQPWQLNQQDILGLLFLGVAATLLAHTFWIKATTELPGVVSGIIYYLYIPLAVSISVVFLKDDLSFTMIIGAVVIIMANVLLVLQKWRVNRQHKIISNANAK